jgi:hypothetical protein
MSKADDILVPEMKKVAVGQETFEIGPMVRAKYGKLINVFAEMLLGMSEEELDNIDENIADVVALISDEALLTLYATVLDKDEEWVNDNLYLGQEIALLETILEVNDVEMIVENFTKVLKRKAIIQRAKEKLNG